MDYQSAIDWLFSQLANYQSQGSIAYKPGLENIEALLKGLDNPHTKLKAVHIAGTNGKGSTAHAIAAMAIENGYKVGLFTSPHIKDFRERIKINGLLLEETYVVDFVNQNQALFERIRPSFFEITTAMAFKAFADKKCELVVIETGLGGRLDASNVLNPILSVITNIGIDHVQFLGDTRSKIAFEKAGIIKKNIPVCIGEMDEETAPVFIKKAKAENARIYRPKSLAFKTDLLGDFQQLNLNLAFSAIQVLIEKGWYFDAQKNLNALNRIKKLTQFKGRLEQLQKDPIVLVDASHNAAGIELLFQEIQQFDFNDLHCVFGSSNDKDFEKSVSLFPKDAHYYFCSFDSSRSLNATDFNLLGKKYKLNYKYYNTADVAYSAALKCSKVGDLVLVFGSFFILEKII
ncbi:bifunctional folylpolyglutamate synthase/dihydrofolate synthase [Putridiphycobacter roseus]|uniref:Dihydrofolate synthase/folylpolyglutamate synthase n=1 Tax=Putridiphycobacter roseus TaxID=2219161 RepID=A0A2W1NNB0_9FLAO|nr:Mur ligase family protein [Putridiphycobacter roseus]PZE17132.1 bifunctional folylpolyglutamate synthase/dihydrofolate synthase [Putridiphycobacter roseus]